MLLYFTLSLMCDITNGSARVLLQLAHGKRAEGEGGDEVFLGLPSTSVTYLMSIMHLCLLLCVLRRETRNIIHHVCIIVGSKNPLFQGEISDIPLCRNLN